jgi:hypothetical protein
MDNSKCIGFLGADWWGSDARAMAMEFRRQGYLLAERHYEDHLSTRWESLSLRLIRRLLLPLIRRQYNRSVAELLSVESLDFLLVFKGMLLEASTLKEFIKRGLPCYLVYPDVSFQDHGKNIWECLPLYDCVFSTKTYHLDDPTLIRRVKSIQSINHGYDPEVHRPVTRSDALLSVYACDVSFVGCWSRKKEDLIHELVRKLPDIDFRLWGPNWGRAQKCVREKWTGRGAYGDELAAIYSCSRINLGLLSEAGTGMSAGDKITARSWQIPASGGLLLHEDTAEIREHFQVDEEVAVFGDSNDLALKIESLLNDTARREQLRRAGYERCISAPYTYVSAVRTITEYHQKRSIEPYAR